MAVLVQNGPHPTKLPGIDVTYTDISPTYISSDLFSPDNKKRITIPALGYQEVQPIPIGAVTWGENTTGYGGTGKLPFLGRHRDRDRDVTRSHKHFGSGVSKYETTIQPYRHTPLMISAARINDQTIPPCFKTYLDPKKHNPSLGASKQKYATHVSRNELFPVNDADRTRPDGEKELSERTRNALKDYYKHLYYRPQHEESFKNLTGTTKQYLRDKKIDLEREAKELADKHYARPKVMIDQNDSKRLSHAEQITQLLTDAPGPRTLATSLLKLLEDATLKEILDALRALTEQIRESRSVLKQEECFVSDRVAQVVEECIQNEEEGICNNMENIDRLRSFLKMLRRPPSGTPYCLPKLEKNLPDVQASPSRPASSRRGRVKSSMRVSGIGICCPPCKTSVLNQLKIRLREVESITGSPKYRHPVGSKMIRKLHGKVGPRPQKTIPPNPDFERFLKEWIHSFNDFPEATKQKPIAGLPAYKKYLDEFLPVKLSGSDSEAIIEAKPKSASKSNKSVRNKSAVKFVKEQTITLDAIKETDRNMKVASESTRKADGDDQVKSKNQDKLPPLASVLQPTGSRIQDRLGLRFKTEAYRRCHAMYTEPVPDLRTSEVFKKKYFFYGFHASAFRG